MSRKTKKKIAPTTAKASLKKTEIKTVEKVVSKPQANIKKKVSNNTENIVATETKHDLIKAIILVSAIFALEFAIFYATLN